ncbi:MAG: hypothetical protein K2Y12_01820 [Chitinophagaceae bacterium]|nr:hypothetical protein [Chitinophagaceae bacterium]
MAGKKIIFPISITIPTAWLSQVLLSLLCIILITSALFIYPLYPFDVGLYDDAQYMGSASFGYYFYTREYTPSNSPLYIYWYKLLIFLTGSNADAYKLNFILLPTISVVLFFNTLRILGASFFCASGISFLFFLSDHLYVMWPMIGIFNLVFLLIAFLLYLKDNVFAACLVILLSCYIRPENTFLLLLLVMATLRRYRATMLWTKMTTLLGIILSIFLLFGFPLSGGRSFYAFAQHFSLNYVSWYKLSFDPWFDYPVIMKNSFGKCNSLWDVVTTNPSLLFRHLFSNLKSFAFQFLNIVSGFIFPDTVLKYFIPFKSSFLLKIFCGVSLFLLLFRIKGINRTQLLILFNRNRMKLIVVCSIVFLQFLICLLYYPRNHYLFPAAFFFWILIIIVFKDVTIARWQKIRWFYIVLIFIASLCIINFMYASNKELEKSSKQISLYKAVKIIENSKDVTIMDFRKSIDAELNGTGIQAFLPLAKRIRVTEQNYTYYLKNLKSKSLIWCEEGRSNIHSDLAKQSLYDNGFILTKTYNGVFFYEKRM